MPHRNHPISRKSLIPGLRQPSVNKPAITILAGLLFLIPLSQAAILGTIQTPEILASRASLAGPLEALQIEINQPTDLQSFHVEGNFGGIIASSSSQYVVNGARLDETVTTEQDIDVPAGHLEVASSAEGVRIIVVPRQATLAATNLDAILAPYLEDITHETRTQARPPLTLPTTNSLAISPIGGTLEIKGTFMVMIYAANLTLTSSTTTQHYTTGLETRPYAQSPIPGTRGIEATTQREAYLEVTDGTLTLALDSQWTAFIRDPVINAASGTITLKQAQGTLDINQGITLTGQDAAFTGNIQYAPRTQSPGSLTGELQGTPKTLQIDGSQITLPQPQDASTAWLVTIAALAIVLAAAYVSYRTTASRGLQSLERLLNQGQYQKAATRATRLMWLPRAHEDAVVAQAVAWMKLGQVSKAKAAINTPPRGRDRTRPGRLYVRARIASLEGNPQDAKQYLAECLLLAPNYLIEALADPVLGPLVKDVKAELAGGYA